MKKFRDGRFGPSVILFAICFVMALALACTHKTTEPAIERAEIEAADTVRRNVLKGSDSFTEVEGVNLPDGVSEVYRGDGGYVFKSGAKGYGGIVTYMIGINDDGEITGIEMFEGNETPGLGTKVGAPGYLESYYGLTDPNEVDGITGATKTTDSLKNAIIQARAAFELVKGAA